MNKDLSTKIFNKGYDDTYTFRPDRRKKDTSKLRRTLGKLECGLPVHVGRTKGLGWRNWAYTDVEDSKISTPLGFYSNYTDDTIHPKVAEALLYSSMHYQLVESYDDYDRYFVRFQDITLEVLVKPLKFQATCLLTFDYTSGVRYHYQATKKFTGDLWTVLLSLVNDDPIWADYKLIKADKYAG